MKDPIYIFKKYKQFLQSIKSKWIMEKYLYLLAINLVIFLKITSKF